MKQKPLLVNALLTGVLIVSSAPSLANTQNGRYPEIYPFVPFVTEHIYEQTQRISEDPGFERNIYDIESLGLASAKTEQQPWTSTYWPLNKGLIADPYEESLQFHRPAYELSWTKNYGTLTDRTLNIHPYVDKLSQYQLDRLAPSEKYDILLGDKSFDLTNRLREYMIRWGQQKEHGFLSMLDKVGGRSLELARQMVANGQYASVEEALPKAIELRGGLAEKMAQNMVERGEAGSLIEALPLATKKAVKEQKNYVLKEKNSMMALWEGICHGWATAAGIVPRPLHSVAFPLNNGKELKFFPTDIKGLASLLWANSLIQDAKYEWKDDKGKKRIAGGVIMEGLRCNSKDPAIDEWGRYYDAYPDYYSKKLEPRCVGVHPAIWHMALVNIIGKQGRSFVVERKVKAEVDNHPMSAYSTQYFNPKTGWYGPLSETVAPIDKYDQFYRFRNPEAKYIVGVRTVMTYLDWERPNRFESDSPEMDSLTHIPMLYDLELDEDGNIVGGQWRAVEVGKSFLNINAERKQPDFFWVVTKDWKKTGYFDELPVSKWTDTTSLPPSDWKEAAMDIHSFVYQQTEAMGWNQKCEVLHKSTGELLEVPCEFKINRPQPMVNVVNKLIELSRE